MIRLVLRPPPSAKRGICWWYVIGMSILLVVFGVVSPFMLFAHVSQSLLYAVAICCITPFLSYPLLFGWSWRSCKFVEAAIEITPTYVQLVSMYGITSYPSSMSSSSSSSMTPNRKNHKQQQQNEQQTRPRRPSIFTTQGSDAHHHMDCDFILQRSHKLIRAQIPITRIIDVIVMEIVWPHCVWSQVAFRVRNNFDVDSKNLDGSCNDDRSKYVYRREENKLRRPAPRRNNTNISDDISNINTQRHSSTPPQAVMQQLLQNGGVSIIPAFPPDDCHGMLSYEECLTVQAEIERLIGL